MPDSDTDVSELARKVVDELDPGSTIGDKVILSRRQLLAIAGSGLSAGALATLGVSEAQAQEAAGAVGTSTDPVDVFGANGDFSQGLTVDGALEAETQKIGTSTAVTSGPVGNTNEWVPLMTIPKYVDVSITNTTYSSIETVEQRMRVAEGLINLTNVKDIGASLAGLVENDTDGEVTSCRVRSVDGFPDTIEISGDTVKNSGIITVDSFTRDNPLIELEGKVSGGTGEIRETSVTLWGKIA